MGLSDAVVWYQIENNIQWSSVYFDRGSICLIVVVQSKKKLN